MNHKQTLSAAIVLISTIVISGACAATAATATTTDPIGDFSFPDITELTAMVSEGNLIVTITCTDSLIDEHIAGAVFMDTDQNYTTGYLDDTGSDYVYLYDVVDIVYADPIKTVTLNDDTIDLNTLNVAGNKITITIPLAMLGNDNGDMDIFVATHSRFVKALNFDRAPDSGVLNTLNGSVRIPHPGNSLAGGSIADLAGDSESPDITGLDVDVENGVVNIAVTYNQNVKPGDLSYGEDLTGWILIDVDQNLATGFTNTEQAPPTFGIDYRIEYAVGKAIGTDAGITKIDHESDLTKSGVATQTMGVLLGVPYNDATFKVVANQVFLGIPLGLLGCDDGDMDVTIDSFTVFGLLDGDIDSAPDFGGGALDTSDGSIKPLLSCTGPAVSITDPVGDSSGFGLDGDDLTGVDVCSAGDVLLVTVAYSSLSLDDGAVTTVAFDTDQNPDSVPDYSVIYFMYEGNLGANIVGNFGEGPDVRDATHLITMLGNKMYLSVPAEFLGMTLGAMNIHVETAIRTGDEDLIYDRAPDTGFISMGSHQMTGDLDLDGKITSADARVALRIVVSGAHNPAADVNGDGQVTSIDALMILKAAAGEGGL